MASSGITGRRSPPANMALPGESEGRNTTKTADEGAMAAAVAAAAPVAYGAWFFRALPGLQLTLPVGADTEHGAPAAPVSSSSCALSSPEATDQGEGCCES
jgi:hypothetical protein